MNYEDVKAKLLWNWTHDEPIASEIYTEDALLEFPQSGEKFRGKENFSELDATPELRCESRRQAGSDEQGVPAGTLHPVFSVPIRPGCSLSSQAEKRSSAQTITASTIASTAGTRNHSATAATPTPAARASMTNC